LLYGISPADPAVLFAAAGFLFAVAGVAAMIPAWIAAGRDPRGRLQND
jgi:hypothetical protein